MFTNMMKKIFPLGTDINVNVETCTPCSQFWMIPGKQGEPRWILPHEPKSALPFLKQWSPYDFRSRIKWRFLIGAYRAKRLNCIPGVIPLQVIAPKWNNWGHLGWFFTNPPVPVIYIGTPGPNRKAVLGLVDSPKNEVKAIGKIPLEPAAGHAINHEADVLYELMHEKPGMAPARLFLDRKNSIATQEFVAGKTTDRRLTEHHMNCLIDLAVPGESISIKRIVEDFTQQIHALEHIDSDLLNIFEHTLSSIDKTLTLPAVWIHGDFAPWNLKNVDNSIRAIDWEAASKHGLPLFDLIYYRSIQAFLFNEREVFSRSDIRIFLKYITSLGISRTLLQKLTALCLSYSWWQAHKMNNQPLKLFFFKLMGNVL